MAVDGNKSPGHGVRSSSVAEVLPRPSLGFFVFGVDGWLWCVCVWVSGVWMRSFPLLWKVRGLSSSHSWLSIMCASLGVAPSRSSVFSDWITSAARSPVCWLWCRLSSALASLHWIFHFSYCAFESHGFHLDSFFIISFSSLILSALILSFLQFCKHIYL